MAHTVLEPNGSILLLTAPHPHPGGRKQSREPDMLVPGLSTPDAAAVVGAIPAVTTFKSKASTEWGRKVSPSSSSHSASGTEDRVAAADHHDHSFSPQG